jgi:hypothetical protein
MKHKDIVIVGAGWYGCHIASILKDKFNITIIEQKEDIFDNSSYYNQNRLHLGYHYSRNFPTRNLCKEKYDRFLKKYEFLVDHIDKNYYVISNNSILDYQTFVNIYKYENFDFELIDNNIFENVDGKIILVKENVINSDKAYNYFKNELNEVKQIFNTKVINCSKANNDKIHVETSNNEIIECDLLFDCTYNQLGLSKKKYIYETTISLVFKKIKENAFSALTIMDGNFSSLYPRDIEKQTYTLTDVEYTPLIKSDNYEDILNYKIDEKNIDIVKDMMISKFEKYYPDFQEYFEYESYFLSKKTKPVSLSDSRYITIEEISKNVITVNCGKIYGIFNWEDYVLNYLENNNKTTITHFNDYKLFTWNNENILYVDHTNLYKDVYLHTGSIKKGEWENCVCFTYINNEEKIISNSNHFIHGAQWGDNYNNMYKIFDNIVKNYIDFREYDVNADYDFDTEKTYFYMVDAFSFSNSGHNLSTVLDFTNYIIKNNIKDILIYKNYKNSHNFKLISLLIPDDCKFIELDENKIYKIKNLIILQPVIFNIYLHKNLIDKLIEIIVEKYAEKFSHLHNKNIVLMKTNRNKNVMLRATQVFCESMLEILENNDFIILIPEEMDIFELCICLLFANKVVLSDGSVLYTNKIFINTKAKLICLSSNGIKPSCSGDMQNSDIKILTYKNNTLTYEECVDFAEEIINF